MEAAPRGVTGAVIISDVEAALVTGANSGIGYAISERLLRDGYALRYATQDDGDEYHEPYERLSGLGPVHWVSGDLADPDVPARLVRETVDALGRLDVLVNNAGLSTAGPAPSIHETEPRPGFAVYAAAKAALGMLTRSFALELAPRIRVVAVAPGAIATERNVEADALAPEIPLGRPGRPEEVADLVAFLCSERASYVTGVSYLIDGGAAQQVIDRPAG